MCKVHSSRLVRVRTANTQTMDSLIASETSGRNENAENVADFQIQNILFSIRHDFSLDKTHTHTHTSKLDTFRKGRRQKVKTDRVDAPPTPTRAHGSHKHPDMDVESIG